MIRFHFDFISPYAYLAWASIHALAERAGVEVEPHPVLFAALLNHHGQKGPAEIAAKRVYVFKDASRTAAVLGLPRLRPPPTHPFNPLLALRVASLPAEPAVRRALIDGLFAATWATGAGVTDVDEVAAIADQAGLPGAVEAATTPENKQRLHAQTAAAIEAGVFGVPTMQVGDELFWGHDSLGHLERYLAGDDPLDARWLERWRKTAPSATR